MGQAKKRGTQEQRIQLAITKAKEQRIQQAINKAKESRRVARSSNAFMALAMLSAICAGLNIERD